MVGGGGRVDLALVVEQGDQGHADAGEHRGAIRPWPPTLSTAPLRSRAMDDPPITYVRHAMPVVTPDVPLHRLAPRRRQPSRRPGVGGPPRGGLRHRRAGDQHRAEGARDGGGHRRALGGARSSRTTGCGRRCGRGSARATGPSPTATCAASGPRGGSRMPRSRPGWPRRSTTRCAAAPAIARWSSCRHGLALSIHLGDRLGADFDRESFWSRLAFPDAWALDHRRRAAPLAPAGAASADRRILRRLLVDGVGEGVEIPGASDAAPSPSLREERDRDGEQGPAVLGDEVQDGRRSAARTPRRADGSGTVARQCRRCSP